MGHRLLLADDSITIQKVVELVLAEEDFEIKSVGNGEEALNALNTFRPDVVLADIEMPRLNGYELCERIKKDPRYSKVPVILLAGAFEPLDEDLVRKVGADDSVIKPFESQELISKINIALTMGPSGGVAGTAGAGEELEAFEAFEDAEGTAEAVELAESDDDLWTLEEEPETPAVFGEEPSTESAPAALSEEPFDFGEDLTTEEPFLKTKEGVQLPDVQETVGMPVYTGLTREEMVEIFTKNVNEKVGAALASIDMKETVASSVAPFLKDAVEKVLWEVAPELVEKMLKDILKESVANLSREVEKVIWETVPDLATSMISREIEKIKAEY